MLFRRNNSTLFLVLFVMFTGITGCANKHIGSYGSEIKNSESMHKATMRSYVVNGKRYYPTMVSVGDNFSGIASWYGEDFHGKKTSNGEIYNMYALTAAHKILPMNTVVRVTNLLNNRSQIVRINDRGPFVKGRIIDLSYTAAKRLGVLGRGTAPVRVEVVGFSGRIQKQNSRYPKRYKSVNISEFLVQIGAFRRLEGARIYKSRLNRRYGGRYKGVIKRSFWEGSYIYRVYLKGFRSEEEARDFVKSQYLSGAFIVRDS